MFKSSVSFSSTALMRRFGVGRVGRPYTWHREWDICESRTFFFFGHSSDTTAETEDGPTPLHMASMERHVELVQFLLERGADATVRAKDGRAPWDLATEKEHVEVVRVLLEQFFF
jgi:hypothetical protein